MRLRLMWTNSYKTKYFATPRSHIFWFLCSQEGGRGLLSSWGCRKSNFVVAEQKAKKRTLPHWKIPLQTSHTCALQTYRPDNRVNFWQETWPWKHETWWILKVRNSDLQNAFPPPPTTRALQLWHSIRPLKQKHKIIKTSWMHKIWWHAHEINSKL